MEESFNHSTCTLKIIDIDIHELIDYKVAVDDHNTSMGFVIKAIFELIILERKAFH